MAKLNSSNVVVVLGIASAHTQGITQFIVKETEQGIHFQKELNDDVQKFDDLDEAKAEIERLLTPEHRQDYKINPIIIAETSDIEADDEDETGLKELVEQKEAVNIELGKDNANLLKTIKALKADLVKAEKENKNLKDAIDVAKQLKDVKEGILPQPEIDELEDLDAIVEEQE